MSDDTGLIQHAPETFALTWNREQIDLLKRTVALGTSDDELRLFAYVCARTGLDPFARQIYAIMRRQKVKDNWTNVMTIQTGIDGYRLLAHRTGKYRGSAAPLWCGADGAWKEIWNGTEGPPFAAKASVLHVDFPDPVVRVAHWDAYVQKTDGRPVSRWATDGPGMLFKCAEAAALRAAFPNELGPVRTFEEMDQAASTGPKVQMPKAKTAEKVQAISPSPKLPKINPWVGALDDTKVLGDSGVVCFYADGGMIEFYATEKNMHEEAKACMSNGKEVRIEWTLSEKGNARVKSITGVMEA